PPISQLVTSMLRESDNTVAELLAKEIGVRVSGQGSTAAGVAAIDAELRNEGLPTDGRNPLDASGLAGDDRETRTVLEAVLVKNGPDSVIGKALPVAAQTGTLTPRFVGTPMAGRLSAKTGTLDQVTALAGFLTTTKGAPVVFTEVLNTQAPVQIHNADVDTEE